MISETILTWLAPYGPFADDAIALVAIVLLGFSLNAIARSKRRRERRRFKIEIDSLIDQAALALVSSGVLELQVFWEDNSTELTIVVTTADRHFQVVSRSEETPVVSMLLALETLFAELQRMHAENVAAQGARARKEHSRARSQDEPRARPASPPPVKKAWWEVLGIGPKASRAEVERSWKDLAKKHHPDLGGSAEAMAEINSARDEARNAIA